LSDASTRTNNAALKANATIVDPTALSTFMSDERISHLFVETCFFARLGFVQPPCCMQCTYRESRQKAVPRLTCKRWVIWRRNANNPLHPSHICDNAIAVQCQSARKLIAGRVVESYCWDRNTKMVVEPPHLRLKRKCA
jgi:hypothetical protein